VTGGYNPDMGTISVHDIERNPSAFLARLAAGEPLRIEDDGRTVADIRPTVPPAPVLTELRPFGLAAGLFKVPDDFDAPLPDDVLRDFEGP
jgi:antitoxin (DNA-binding transcriptional repressor) of toxin-antitoxin stability system